MWERGLKLLLNVFNDFLHNVAPHVGAWIETQRNKERISRRNVAPHVGAWIET